jgi:hypothetical protein
MLIPPRHQHHGLKMGGETYGTLEPDCFPPERAAEVDPPVGVTRSRGDEVRKVRDCRDMG